MNALWDLGVYYWSEHGEKVDDPINVMLSTDLSIYRFIYRFIQCSILTSVHSSFRPFTIWPLSLLLYNGFGSCFEIAWVGRRKCRHLQPNESNLFQKETKVDKKRGNKFHSNLFSDQPSSCLCCCYGCCCCNHSCYLKGVES